jgi:hypothetical protein
LRASNCTKNKIDSYRRILNILIDITVNVMATPREVVRKDWPRRDLELARSGMISQEIINTSIPLDILRVMV